MKFDAIALIEQQFERYKSILAIPKGPYGNLVEAITHILDFVHRNENITTHELTEHLRHTFCIAHNTAVFIRPTLERSNLLMTIENKVKLTTIGNKFIKTKALSYLTKGFVENYFGFLELILAVEEDTQKSLGSIQERWNAMFFNEFGYRSKKTNSSQFLNIVNYSRRFGLIEEEPPGNIKVNYELLNEIFKIDIF